MTRRRAIDEHADAMRALEAGRLVEVRTRGWCEAHDAPASPHCSSCAGDHRAGEHYGQRPKRTCAACYPTPVPPITHQPYAERTSR